MLWSRSLNSLAIWVLNSDPDSLYRAFSYIIEFWIESPEDRNQFRNIYPMPTMWRFSGGDRHIPILQELMQRILSIRIHRNPSQTDAEGRIYWFV